MVIGVCGSRNYDNRKGLVHALDAIYEAKKDKITGFVSGGARGPDSWGEEWARGKGIPITVHKPDWEKHGKQAGFIRNVDIVNDSTVIIAFYDGSSSGTLHTMKTGLSKGKKVYVVNPEGEMSKFDVAKP